MNGTPGSAHKEMAAHFTIAVAVLLLLGLSVGVSFLELGGQARLVIGLGIAGVQVFLIAGFLMHAVYEHIPVVLIIAVALFALASCVVLMYFGFFDHYEGVSGPVIAPVPKAPH